MMMIMFDDSQLHSQSFRIHAFIHLFIHSPIRKKLLTISIRGDPEWIRRSSRSVRGSSWTKVRRIKRRCGRITSAAHRPGRRLESTAAGPMEFRVKSKRRTGGIRRRRIVDSGRLSIQIGKVRFNIVGFGARLVINTRGWRMGVCVCVCVHD